MDTVVQVGSSLDAAIAQAHKTYTVRRPNSAALRSQALEVMPGGNTRTVLNYAPFPTAMARGEGCTLWDIDGNEYLDLCGEYTAGLFGHSEERIHLALRCALERGLSLAAVGEAEAKLARIICHRFPGIEQVRFTNSGTEANLMAMTVARAFTGRSKLLVFRGGYHGSILMFASLQPHPVTAPYPFIIAEYNDIAGTLSMIRENAADLAAVILEPMLGGGGGIAASADFLVALRTATREAGALLVFDEVMTSRMSGGGMQARSGITPDLTALGKYMAGGMSFGAFGGRRDIMGCFATMLPHAGTFNNNVMSMAGGLVALGEIFTPDVADNHYERGENLRDRLNAECQRSGLAMQFTGVGSILVAHFRAGILRQPYLPTAIEEQLRELFFFDMLQEGIYMARRGMVALSLPVTDSDLDRFVHAIRHFLQQRYELFTLPGIGSNTCQAS